MIYYNPFSVEALLDAMPLFAIAWILTRMPLFSEAIHKAFTLIFNKFPKNNFVLHKIYEAVTCQKCLTFWLILLIMANPLVALTYTAIIETFGRD